MDAAAGADGNAAASRHVRSESSCSRTSTPPLRAHFPVFNRTPNGRGPMSEGNRVQGDVKHVKVISSGLIEGRLPPSFTPLLFV